MKGAESRPVDGRFPTLCGMCGRYTRCGMYVTVTGGRITRVEPMAEHIGAKGFFCPKARAALDFQYSPHRLTHPLKKTPGGLERCSWDEAFDILCDRLTRVRDEYGAHSLAVYLGMTVTPMLKYAKRFCDLFGTPNICSAASYCNYSAVIANVMTFGSRLEPDISRSRTILLCGGNPAESNRLRFKELLAAKRRGAKLIVVDPRLTETAKIADLHTAIRPGTDLALGLALLHVVIEENLYDREFVERYTTGFDALAAHVRPYTPEWAEETAWVPAQTVRQIARIAASERPTAIVTGIGPQHSTNGSQAVRSFNILAALLGCIEAPGGNIFPAGAARVNSFRIKEKFPKIKGAGVERFPLLFRILAEANATAVRAAVLTGEPYPVRAMLVQGGNPMSAWPEATRTEEALGKLDFLAVMDLRMTDTARLADLVLPAAFFFERTSWDMWPILAIQNRIVPPREECLPDWEFWRRLAAKFGWGDDFPWKDIEEAIDWELQPAGVTVGKMRDNPGGFRLFEWTPRRYAEKGFNTPSKRVEIYSKRMEELGLDPLPAYHEAAESPAGSPGLFRDYPLVLTTGGRQKWFNNSELRDCPGLLRRDPVPRVEIHPQTAAPLGIGQGDPVWVETSRGRARFSADLRTEIDSRVVEAKHGWPGDANANLLTGSAQDPVSGFPPFRVSLCRVYKAGE